LLVAALSQVDEDEAAQQFSFGGAIAGVARGTAGVLLGGDNLEIVATSLEVSEQGGSQAHGVGGPAAGRGVRDDRGQGGSFVIQPGPCRGYAGDCRARSGGEGNAGPSVRLAWKYQIHRDGGGVQVMVEQAGKRLPAFLRTFAGSGEFAGVDAQQVMHAISAELITLDEVSLRQRLKQADGSLESDARQGGRRVGIEVWARVQAQAPERPDVAGVQVPAGPGKHCPYSGARLAVRVQKV